MRMGTTKHCSPFIGKSDLRSAQLIFRLNVFWFDLEICSKMDKVEIFLNFPWMIKVSIVLWNGLCYCFILNLPKIIYWNTLIPNNQERRPLDLLSLSTVRQKPIEVLITWWRLTHNLVHPVALIFKSSSTIG